MRILVVKRENSCYPFVEEQVECLKSKGIDCYCFLIRGKGWKSYIQSFPAFLRIIRTWHPDIIHAHYGLGRIFQLMNNKDDEAISYGVKSTKV